MTDLESLLSELEQHEALTFRRVDVPENLANGQTGGTGILLRTAALLRAHDIEGDITQGGTLASVVNWTRTAAVNGDNPQEVCVSFGLDGAWRGTGEANP